MYNSVGAGLRGGADGASGGGGKPFLGDSPAFGSAREVAIANGYQPLIDDLKLPIVDWNGSRYQTAR